jgi:hypothetical protein
MWHHRIHQVALVVSTLALVLGSTARAADPAPPSETAKVEALLELVENLKEARFVRNGREYDGAAAAQHMRAKWRWQGRSIKTAREFVRLIATRSSETGQPYLIRWKDGKQVASGDYLNRELDRLEGKPAASR